MLVIENETDTRQNLKMKHKTVAFHTYTSSPLELIDIDVLM